MGLMSSIQMAAKGFDMKIERASDNGRTVQILLSRSYGERVKYGLVNRISDEIGIENGSLKTWNEDGMFFVYMEFYR